MTQPTPLNAVIDSGNVLPPYRRQTVTWTNYFLSWRTIDGKMSNQCMSITQKMKMAYAQCRLGHSRPNVSKNIKVIHRSECYYKLLWYLCLSRSLCNYINLEVGVWSSLLGWDICSFINFVSEDHHITNRKWMILPLQSWRLNVHLTNETYTVEQQNWHW